MIMRTGIELDHDIMSVRIILLAFPPHVSVGYGHVCFFISGCGIDYMNFGGEALAASVDHGPGAELGMCF